MPFTPLKVMKNGRSETVWQKHHFTQVKLAPYRILRVEMGGKIDRTEI
jgi:hypothetical protein